MWQGLYLFEHRIENHTRKLIFIILEINYSQSNLGKVSNTCKTLSDHLSQTFA